MPQPYPAVPQRPDVPARPQARRVAATVRRALVLSVAGLAVTAAHASAQAEAGAAPAPSPAGSTASPRAATPASTALTRATIRSVQRKLRLRADGRIGPRTRAAIRRFQRRHRLPVTGRLHAETLRKLGVTGKAASAGSAPAAVNLTAEDRRILAAIAECESGGNPTAVSANGDYRGKYQFLTSTWASMGGTGDPAAAPEAEQDQRAAELYAKQGVKPWPVCGKRATASS